MFHYQRTCHKERRVLTEHHKCIKNRLQNQRKPLLKTLVLICFYTKHFLRVKKLPIISLLRDGERDTFYLHPSVNTNHRKQPPLPVFAPPPALFRLFLFFKSSLHQRFLTRPNGCRISCSCVNWSISARLKSADGVA